MNLYQQIRHDHLQSVTRRHFLRDCATGLGSLWLSSTLGRAFGGQGGEHTAYANTLAVKAPHFPAKAKRVIFLHMAGAPSQFELFDYKPALIKYDGQPCPQSFLEGQRFAFISGIPELLGPKISFNPSKGSGAQISDALPHFREIVDEVCLIKSMHTDQFNHAPAQLLMHTGNAQQGHASIGAWTTYGLGTENENLPGFIVLVSGGKNPSGGKATWSSGYLPSVYQGVQCRSEGDPVLFLSNPKEITRDQRRRALDTIEEINLRSYEEAGDPEILTRISQYEMASRMQLHASDAFDLKSEPESVLEMYGAEPGVESFANNCLLARRLAERDVRYIQLFDWGWDHHGTQDKTTIDKGLSLKCKQIDQPIAALWNDLKRHGLLDDTLVIWGGEFGRTPMRELRAGVKNERFGRDHHKEAFTMWIGGAGIRPGVVHGETDELGFFTTRDPVHVRDLQGTLLHLLGFDSQKLIYPYQGLNQKLTGVAETPKIVSKILS